MVFSGFIDQCEITLSFGIFIRNDLINLAFFEMLAILVSHAKRKPIIFFGRNINPKTSLFRHCSFETSPVKWIVSDFVFRISMSKRSGLNKKLN